jgi:hypothetical protein
MKTEIEIVSKPPWIKLITDQGISCSYKYEYNKSDWVDGPWKEEPDLVEWTDKETGYDCLILRSTVAGALCGYVAIKRGHPYYEKDFMDDSIDVEVHGGLTYSNYCQGHICHKKDDVEPVWWLGFDCAHCYDLMPKITTELKNIRAQNNSETKLLDATERLLGTQLPEFFGLDKQWEIYRDIPYVINEVLALAQQLKVKESHV